VAEARVILGDALEALRGMEPGSVDAVCADPPAGISFMGLPFDSFGAGAPARSGYKAHNKTTMLANGRGLTVAASAKNRAAFVAFLTPIMAECLRVCRPGAVALVWALPRTSHWTGTALEDAGWDIEDKICHLFGTGFPKHRSKLKPGHEEWILCRKPGPKWLGVEECRVGWQPSDLDPRQNRSITPRAGLSGDAYGGGPNTYGDGSGVERKPFVERMSPAGRYPANLALSHHESCVCRGTKRVRGSNGVRGASTRVYGGGKGFTAATGEEVGYAGPDGKEEVKAWDCHPECAIRLLDEQAGERPGDRPGRKPRVHKAPPGGNGHTLNPGWTGCETPGHTDTGGPSRFFYVAKAPGRERWFYCTDCGDAFEPGERNRHGHGHVDGDGKPDWKHLEAHPTQKSLALMRWLVRLACPTGGLVLDCFAGSGSAGVACLETGRRFVGIDDNPAYHAIAERRLAAAAASLPGEES
jgi:DNA modification methylase